MNVALLLGIALLGGAGAVARFLLDGAVGARAGRRSRGGRWPSTCRARSCSAC